ncbi:MAG: hypothetical protein AB7O59_11260 [Pirellulales bacterium]
MPHADDDNPYASPRVGAGESSYYQFVPTNASFGEIWHLTFPNVVAFAIVALAKCVRLKVATPLGFAPEQITMAGPSALPAEARHAMAPSLAELAAAGFTPKLVQSLPLVGNAEVHTLIHANHDGTILGSTVYARHVRRSQMYHAVGSKLADGRFLSTSGAPERLRNPPQMEVLRRRGASIAALLELHRRRLSENASTRPVAFDDAGLRACLRENELATLEFHRARKVWVPMSVVALERLRAGQ